MVTFPTSQAERSPSKSAAPLKVALKFVTLLVSHAEIFTFKVAAVAPQYPAFAVPEISSDAKRNFMSATLDTSHSLMGPYVATAVAGSVQYAATAVCKVVASGIEVKRRRTGSSERGDAAATLMIYSDADPKRQPSAARRSLVLPTLGNPGGEGEILFS